METYLQITGDTDGVTVEADGGTQTIRPRCHESRWWLAPTCRENSTECIPSLLYDYFGFPWHIEEVMQKAAVWEMPLAIGSAFADFSSTSGPYFRLPLTHDVVYVAVHPDIPNFFPQATMQIAFPRHSAREWQRGVASSMSATWSNSMIAHKDLGELAPDFQELLRRMRFYGEDYEHVSLAISTQVDQGQATLLSLACEWLQNNTEVWKAWVPVVTSCFPGHGLFGDGSFVSSRDNATTCRPCPPGSYSSPFYDYADTAQCQQCSPGYWQSSYGAVTCSPCSPGKFANDTGSTLCNDCAQGQYQSAASSSSCEVCDILQTTSIRGATEQSQCICKPGSFRGATGCELCSTGLRCEGGDIPLRQEEGFWVEVGSQNSLSVYRCRDYRHCPEGVPGNCASQRVGRACAVCRLGYWAGHDESCRPCQTLSMVYVLVVAAVVLFVGVFPFAAFCSCSSFTTKRTLVSFAIATIMGGQTAIALQAFQAISQLNILWVQPVKEFLRILAIALNGFQTGVTCFVEGTSFATWSFALQLLGFPAFVALTSLPAVAAKIGRGINLFSGLFNIYGLILVALLTAISIAVVMPLKCRKNPNLTYTLEAHPQVICWNSQEHETLVLLSVIGVLVYPATILSMLLWATYKYPRWLRSDRGVETLHRLHFLFGRFRPERYQCCLIFTVMNFLIAITPVCLPTAPQIVAMCVLLWVKQVVHCLWWPWKIEAANWSELVLSGCTVLFFSLATPLLDLEDGGTETQLSILLVIIFLGLPVCFVGAAICAVLSKRNRSHRYTLFLSHHKLSSSMLCRYIKVVVAKLAPAFHVFYDADNLHNLDTLFGTLKNDVDVFLAVLSANVFSSFWCIAEMTTAFANKVPMLVLRCDDPPYIGENFMDLSTSSWAEEQLFLLHSNGLSLEDVQATVAHVLKLPHIQFLRTGSASQQEASIIKVLQNVSGCPVLGEPSEGSVERARLLVCGGAQPEAISSMLVMQQLLQSKLQVPCYVVRHAAEIGLSKKASRLVVVLTQGIFAEEEFAELVLSTDMEGWAKVVVNDGSFDFPSPSLSAYRDLQNPELSAAYKSLCGSLALPFTPHLSETLLHQQMEHICRRLADDEQVGGESAMSRVLTRSSSMASPAQRTASSSSLPSQSDGGIVDDDDGNADYVQEAF
ncbi:unnamed protein product [Symbiodinium sp. CCMP2592]|nr:unnamed protein product [Symbiodinium sp. CCMP2592]